LGLDADRPLLCIMPGSRSGEVALMGELFLMVAVRLLESNPLLQFVIPAANGDRHRQLTEILAEHPELPVTLIEQQSLLAMESADAVLLASGTTALEAMLLQKPMVVSYKLGNLTYKLVRPFIKTPFASIPNLLAGEMLVPELIQDEATVESLSAAVINALDENARELVKQRFNQLYEQINLPSGDTAAAAISKLISQ
jgi:lipid-A-disaccharide synthase